MDDLTTMNPAKLKRRKRSSASTASVVDLPAVGDAPSGSLLGDDLISDAARASTRSHHSLLDLIPVARDAQPAGAPAETPSPLLDNAPTDDSLNSKLSDDKFESQSQMGRKNQKSNQNTEDNKSGERQSIAALKPAPAVEHGSPLDALRTDDEINAPAAPDPATPTDPQASVRSLAAQKARRRQTPPPAEPADTPAPIPAKLESLLAQQRDIQTQCIDTLTQLRNTNALNERRYALYLTVGFGILVVVAAVGIFFGVNKQNSAKYQELRFKHEVYTSTLNEKNILAAEYEKEKQGAVAAFEIFKRIENGQLEEAVESFNDTNDRITHPAERALLAHRIDQIRWELAENAFNNGIMLYNDKNFEQARDAFFKSLSLKESTAYAPRLYYFLAMALYQTSDFEGARRFFARIQPGDLNSEMDANTRYYRAVSAEKTGNDAEAYEQFDQFIKKYRYHKLAEDASKRRTKLDQPKN